MAKYKKLPYGISDFAQIRRENLYVVDKTRFVEEMEDAGHFLFLIRPRRFGKSLFLSMLSCYYDVNERENFDQLFSGLYVHSNPTEFRNSFQVLRLDFSRVGGNAASLQANLDSYMRERLDNFAKRYEHLYDESYYRELSSRDGYEPMLEFVKNEAERKRYPLYLIVDEYDNFTNNVLNAEGEAVYHSMTHAEGFYRDLFKKFKGMFARILMMGVSPVTMDDLTSGYNIARALTLDPVFNSALGFDEDEVRQMIRYYREAGVIAKDEEAIVSEIKPWYNGYCFADEALCSQPKLFNCDMVIYYLNSLIRTGVPPKQMVDANTMTDYQKLNRIVSLDRLDGNRKSVIMQVVTNGHVIGNIEQSFPAHRLTEPSMFVSLLYYYGMLTITGVDGAELVLGIPNNNVRVQYYDYLLKEYDKIKSVDFSALTTLFRNAALDGLWRPLMEYVCQQYRDTASVRSLIEGERNIQGFMTAYFSLCAYYLTAPEVEVQHGYLDLFLMPDFNRCATTAHAYIVELKYLKASETDSAAQSQWESAVEQIKGYAKGPMVRKLCGGAALHLIVIQMKGHDLLRMEEVEE